MVNNKAKTLARYSIQFAVIFVAMMIDKAISFIPVGFSMAVCVLLVTLSFCFLDNSWTSGVLSGLFFGLASFVKEFIMPSATLGQIFPPQYWLLVTVPSRVLMSTAAFACYRLMLVFTKKIASKKLRQFVCITVASFVGLVVNTIAFLSSLELARAIYSAVNVGGQMSQSQGVFATIYLILFTNIVPEYAICLACVASITIGLRKGLKLGLDGNNARRLAANETVATSQQ